MGPYDEYHEMQPNELNVATRTTLVFVATGGAYTLLAHLCGATLPPEPYYIFAFIVSIQALIHSNSESVARWMRGHLATERDVFMTRVIFDLIVLLGSTASNMARVIMHNGVATGPQNTHEEIIQALSIVIGFFGTFYLGMCGLSIGLSFD
jgi:hypothetical protein